MRRFYKSSEQEAKMEALTEYYKLCVSCPSYAGDEAMITMSYRVSKINRFLYKQHQIRNGEEYIDSSMESSNSEGAKTRQNRQN